MSKTEWHGTITVNNNTSFNIQVVQYRKVGMTKHEIAEISAGQQGWSNTMTKDFDQVETVLNFYTTDKKHPYMSCKSYYGPTDGLSVDRGNLSEQTIQMEGNATQVVNGNTNNKNWWQTGDLTEMQTIVFLPTPNNASYDFTLTFSEEVMTSAVPPTSEYDDRL